MQNDLQRNNPLTAAAASRCWVARAGAGRKPWPHPYRLSEASAFRSGTLPQNMRDPSIGVGPASTRMPAALESK